MHTTEYATQDACGLAELLATGEVTPAEVAVAASDAHRRLHARGLGAVIEWYEDPANPLTAIPTPPETGHGARGGERPGGPGQRRDPPIGTVTPMAGGWAGVPVLRKDYGATEAGRLVERGSRLSVGWRASTTSALIRQLSELGVVVRGRTAVPEFILHATTESRLSGITVNPWNPALSAGGSSGGSAAAVAAGIVPVAHASDCAGSIRIPAAVCGLIGLKPTRGRVPWGESFGIGGWGGIAEEFVLTRTVRDARMALAALSLTHSDRKLTHRPNVESTSIRPYWVPEPLLPSSEPLSGLRIGLVLDHWAGLMVDPTLRAALEGAGRALESAGHVVAPIDWPVPYERLAALMDPLFGLAAASDIATVAAVTGRTPGPDTLEPLTLEYLDSLRSLPPNARAYAGRAAIELTAELERWLGPFDVLACSTLGRAELPLGRLGGEVSLAQWSRANDEFTPHSFVANVTGWPALSLPWGPGPSDVPIGIQLLGRRGEDELLLQLAETLSRSAPPLGQPALHAAR